MPKPRILVIDDDLMITKLLKEHLTNEGCEVTSAHLAEAGFKMAAESLPDLIFLDVMLPDATGFQTLGRLRENFATKAIPIIMMTGTATNANQKEIGKGMGADDYVLKPFNVMDVGERAKQLLHGKNGSTPPETAPMKATEAEPALTFSNIDALIKPPQPIHEEKAPPAWAPTDFLPKDTAPEPMPQAVRPPPVADEPETSAAPQAASTRWWFTSVLFLIYLGITYAATDKDVARAMTFAAGGWALLLGYMVASCAVFRIPLDAEQAMKILGWASIPISAREIITMTGVTLHTAATLPLRDLWLRPLDLFEMASVVIIGVSLGRLPGSSVVKSVGTVLLITAGWLLTSRGYFHPY